MHTSLGDPNTSYKSACKHAPSVCHQVCTCQIGMAAILQEAVQEFVSKLCKSRMSATLHAWQEHCQAAAMEREAERQSLQATVRRLARARLAAVLAAWQAHAKLKQGQRQLCMHAIR